MENPATHTMVALTFWQMGAHAVTPVPPSPLLVNAGKTEPDPLDSFLGKHCLELGHDLLSRSGKGLCLGGTPGNGHMTMLKKWLSDDSNDILLRVEQPEDHAAFRRLPPPPRPPLSTRLQSARPAVDCRLSTDGEIPAISRHI